MSFFDDVDASGIVENHIQDVLKLEHSEADSILSRYDDVRANLVRRLERLPPRSFTAQHLRGVLAQVKGAIGALNNELETGLYESSIDTAKSGVEDLITEINGFDEMFTGAVTPINLNAAVLATDTANLLVTKYRTNLDAYGAGLLGQISNGLFMGALGAANYEEIVSHISNYFQGEEWRLRRIVRTELHNIYNMGKIRGMRSLVEEEQLPDLQKTLIHPMDARTGDDSIFAASLNLVAGIDEPFEYVWAGKLRSYMAPPDRPNDRSILVPYRESWGKAAGDSLFPGKYAKA